MSFMSSSRATTALRGRPLAMALAMVMRDIYPGSLGGTYGGNPIACAVALKVLEMIEREKIVDKSAALGVKLRKRLDEFYDSFEVIGEVRGKGPMLAMEMALAMVMRSGSTPQCSTAHIFPVRA